MALAVGVVVGAVLGVALHINYFAEPAWIVGACLAMVLAYLRPKCVFVVVALLAGMILVFGRVTVELQAQRELGDKYEVTAGLETEAWVMETRDFFAGRIKGLMDEPEALLGLSYLLGMKAGLPDDLADNLKTVGLVHIVVASGAHLAILVEIARKIVGRVSRFFSLLFAGVLIMFFMAMVGWTPSILRAGLMALLTLLAWYSGRKFEPWRIILIVGAMTLLINPLFITNLGWLLSFAAFIGIMILGPGITRYLYGNKKPGWVAAMLITTLSATLMTLPITLYYFGQISLIAVVANLLILPTLAWAMGLVFLTGVVAGVPVIEMVAAWCATRLLDFHIVVVEWCSQMEWFLVKIDRYQGWVFVLYIIIVAVWGIGLIWQKMVKLKEAKLLKVNLKE